MEERLPTTNRAASDEIDIREVFAAIGRSFRRIGNSFILAILKIRQATKKFAWLIITCMLIGAGIGYFGYRSFQTYYASDLTLSSNYYNSEMLKSAIRELDQLAGEGNNVVLARKLNITPEQSAVIRSLRVEPVTSTSDAVEIENLLRYIRSNEEITEEQIEELRTRLMAEFTSFKIITTVYDLSVLDALEQGIILFLKDNDYIRRRVAIQQENLIAMRDKLLREQERLERLKTLQADVYGRLAETGRAGSNNVIFGTPETATDPLNVYREDLLFSRELLKTNERIELNRGLEIVSGFTPYGAPASLSLRSQLLIGALIGLGVAYLIIIMIGINQALNRYETTYTARKTTA
ncbi:hypothetical protein D770_17595 [Flammeovirgaceae bacterium 311]|nr:hypothetical protein D770_17595 [Flammeovirgaceae bacterium 311]